MAANAPASDASAAPPKKPSKLPLILAIVGLLVGLGGAGGGFYAWKVASAKAEEQEDEKPARGDKSAKGKEAKDGKDAKDKDKKGKEKKPAVFLPAETFTVNLQKTAGRDHFLQVGIVLEMADQPTADAVKAQLPVIRSQILLLLAARNADELATPQGKDQLAAQLLERVKKPLENGAENAGVEGVHYAAFIIQ